MDKLDILVKVAIQFGVIKDILSKFKKEKNIFIRDNSILPEKNSLSTIGVTHNDKFVKIIKVIRNQKLPNNEILKPRNIFLHENGHGTVFSKQIKKNKDANINPVDYVKKVDKKSAIIHDRIYNGAKYDLKDERQANKNALSLLKNPKDRKDYINDMNKAYKTYQDDFKKKFTTTFLNSPNSSELDKFKRKKLVNDYVRNIKKKSYDK